ncbi:MAG: long-chain fatty acid--CoA ligase [Pseudomonadota bacterium]|nr:MAG: long-chain fatty acid--CoA ligase [Pseudomonadota bacterium]
MAGNPSYIGANVAGTLDGLFRERVLRSPGVVAFASYDSESNAWRDTTWAEMGQLVGRFQEALRGEDLQPGDRVALQLRNCLEWVAFEQAALGLGLVVVPLYVDDRADNVAYILGDAGIKVLLLQTPAQWTKLVEASNAHELDTLQRVLIHRQEATAGAAAPDDERLMPLADWLGAEHGGLHERGGDPNALATIVYTSGTTGRPKGVMLSHRNILTVADTSLQVIDANAADRLLSFLPLSHTFERTCGYYTPMMAGASVAFARSIQQLADDIASWQPTIIVCVPRIFERIYERLHKQLAEGPRAARLLFGLATRIGWRRFLTRQGRARRGPSLLLWPLLQRLVANKLQQRLGGQLRLAVSGGAALPAAVSRLFLSLDIPIIQGYGMTETSPVVSANTLTHNEPYSVGRPLPGIAVRIGENEELLVKTPGTMLGYWNNHRATREVIYTDGWVHTGDQARIDGGYIYITGRIKDILVMSNGEKVPPGDMESAITLDPLFDQALILGEGKAFLGALVVLNPDYWFSLAKQHQLDPFDKAALRDQKLNRFLAQHIGELLRDFPGYAKVRRVAPLLEPWTIDNGLLTPTLKIKRALVLERYTKEVERLYQ